MLVNKDFTFQKVKKLFYHNVNSRD